MFGRQSLPELKAELEALETKISHHPLASEPVKRAHLIIEGKGDKSNETVESELAAAGLPSLAELGKVQLESTGSWWRLHRDRNKVLKKIEKFKPSE